MAIEIPQNEEISGGGKDGGREGIGSAIRRAGDRTTTLRRLLIGAEDKRC